VITSRTADRTGTVLARTVLARTVMARTVLAVTARAASADRVEDAARAPRPGVGCRQNVHPPLGPALRAAPSARRLCSPDPDESRG
jgi:hypothetical protein